MIRNILIVFCLILSTVPLVFGQADLPLIRFDQLVKYDAAQTAFRVEGYVLDIYKCPPCPPRAMCKPCIPDNITLVERADPGDLSKVQRLRVYTERTDLFEKGKKYTVAVRVKGTLTPGMTVESVDMILDSQLSGSWKGTSICTIKDSPCHDENVIYHISGTASVNTLNIDADKVVGGKPEPMGSLACNFDPVASFLKCPMNNGIWEFKITGTNMSGTLTLPDGRLFRRISVTRDH